MLLTTDGWLRSTQSPPFFFELRGEPGNIKMMSMARHDLLSFDFVNKARKNFPFACTNCSQPIQNFHFRKLFIHYAFHSFTFPEVSASRDVAEGFEDDGGDMKITDHSLGFYLVNYFLFFSLSPSNNC